MPFSSAAMDKVLTISPFHRDTNSTTTTLQWQQGPAGHAEGILHGLSLKVSSRHCDQTKQGNSGKKMRTCFSVPQISITTAVRRLFMEKEKNTSRHALLFASLYIFKIFELRLLQPPSQSLCCVLLAFSASLSHILAQSPLSKSPYGLLPSPLGQTFTQYSPFIFP